MNLSPLAATANPHLLAQGQQGLANAQARDVNSLADPKTYAFVSGLMGTPPDQQGFSVFKPNLPDIKSAGEVGYGLGLGAQALPFMGAAAKVAPAVGRELAGTAVDRMLSGQSIIPGMPASMVNPPVTSIIKQGGGNWVDQGGFGVDKYVDNLKRFTPHEDIPFLIEKDLKIDDWIDKKLKPYVRNQMGTPNDPIRAQADKDKILHMPLNEDFAEQDRLGSFHKHMREQAGFPREGVATSDLGKQWEYLTDSALNNARLETLNNPKFYNNPSILEKLDPSTPMNYVKDQAKFDKLGFDHLIDVLHEKVNDGEITYKDLDKLSVTGAVKHTHEYDQKAREAIEKAERENLQYANIAHKTDDGVVVKLDRPGQFAKESDNMGHSVRGYEPPKGNRDYLKETGNSGSASYNHGGWNAIKSGRAEVYSVRDFDNKPHATVEVLNKQRRPDITQIKGPVNGYIDYKPAETLKSFLNSRLWGKVKESEKAGLIDLANEQSRNKGLYDVLGDYKLPHEREQAFREATAANPRVQRFMNRQEFKDFVDPPKPVVPEKPKEPHGKGWWYNSDNKQLHEISHSDLGPHGDHDGWISVGDNAEKLGVDPKVASAWQDANYGFMLPKEKVQAGLKTGEIKPNDPIDSNGEMYYNQSFGDRLKIADQHYLEKHGVPIENYEMTPPPQELENLVRIRQWPSGHVSFDLTGNANDNIVKGISSTIDKIPSLWKAPKISVYTEADEPFNFTPESFSKLKTMRDLKRYHDPSLGKTQNAEGFKKGGRVKRNLKKAPSMEMSLLDAIKKHYPEGLSDAMKTINKYTAPKKKTLKIDDMRYALMKGT